MGFMKPKIKIPPQLADPKAAAQAAAPPPAPTPVDPVVQQVRAEEKIKRRAQTGISGTRKTGPGGPKNPAMTTFRALYGEDEQPKTGTLLK